MSYKMTYEELAAQALVVKNKRNRLGQILGMEPSRWIVLGAIIDGYDQSSTIAKHLNISMAHATNSITDLEAKGYVKREAIEDDKRASKVVFVGKREWFDEMELEVKRFLEEQ